MDELLILMIIIVTITVFLFLGEKVRISAISIELLIGMFLGVNGVFPIFKPTDNIGWLQFLADLGFILLMFLAGLELNVHFLKKFFKKSVVLVICVFTISFLTGFSLGMFIQLQLFATLLLGIVFAGASVGIAFPLLRELGLSQKRIGQVLIAATMALDIICILIISFIEFTAVGTFNVVQFIIIIVVIILFLVIILFFITPFWKYVEKQAGEVKALEWEIRVTFAVIMVLAVLTGILLEIEAIIGAFLAGMIMGQSKSAERIEEKIGSIGYGFFIPIFFFVIGMKMNVSYFTDPVFILMLVSFVLILFAIKIGSSLLGSKLMGFPWKTGLITGFVMIPSLTVGIAAVELGQKLTVGALNDQTYTLIISIIVITAIIVPIITRNTAPRLIPTLISKHAAWYIHLEHELGIYLNESYHNVFEEVTIGDLPIKESKSVRFETPITSILELIEQHHQMNFPVVSANNHLLGIVDFDDVKKFILGDKLSETAGMVMRREIVFVTSTDPLSVALDKMRKFDFELLPIVEEPSFELIGTVTRDDILRFIRIRALDASITPEDIAAMDKKEEKK